MKFERIPIQLGILALIAFFISLFLVKPLPLNRADYIAPPKVILNLTAGHKWQMSDSFWLRAIQDFDHCDQPLNERECKGKSWLFHVIDLTTDLDLKFRDAFFYGSLALTIIISDYEGASKIFDKAVLEFPLDWYINYNAGYHALFEEKDKKKASTLFAAAAKNGAPNWVHVLAGRLAADAGDIDYAAKILEQMIADNQDPKLIERLQNKLKELKK